MTTEKTIQTRADLETALRRITFAPSCLALAWEWQAEEVHGAPSSRAGLLGWRVRTSFQRPDTATGEIGRGFGRWELINVGTSESGVVKTAWLLCKLIVEHELHEAFLVDGVRIFDPHRTVAELQMPAKLPTTERLLFKERIGECGHRIAPGCASCDYDCGGT